MSLPPIDRIIGGSTFRPPLQRGGKNFKNMAQARETGIVENLGEPRRVPAPLGGSQEYQDRLAKDVARGRIDRAPLARYHLDHQRGLWRQETLRAETEGRDPSRTGLREARPTSSYDPAGYEDPIEEPQNALPAANGTVGEVAQVTADSSDFSTPPPTRGVAMESADSSIVEDLV